MYDRAGKGEGWEEGEKEGANLEKRINRRKKGHRQEWPEGRKDRQKKGLGKEEMTEGRINTGKKGHRDERTEPHHVHY